MAKRSVYAQEELENRLRKNLETLKINAKGLRERYGRKVRVEDLEWGPRCDVEDLQLFFEDAKPRR